MKKGTEALLYFNEGAYNGAVNRLESETLPLVEDLRDAYNALSLKDFGYTIFSELMMQGVEKTKMLFFDATAEDLKQFKSPVFRNKAVNIDEYLGPVDAAIQQVKNSIATINQLTSGYVPLDHTDIKITSSHATINREELQKKFELRLETETQVEIHDHLKKAADACNKARKLIESKGTRLGVYGIVGSALLYDANGDMVVNKEAFKRLPK